MHRNAEKKSVDSPYLTFPEALEYLRMGNTALRQLVRNRKIRYIRQGRKILFRRTDLDAFLDAKAVEPFDAKAAVDDLFCKKETKRA